jgi:hypothetical protein
VIAVEREGLGSLQPVTDADGIADWVIGGVPGELTIGTLLPAGFAAYARLLHPAHLEDVEVRWAAVARANNRRAHPGMQWEALGDFGEQPGLWDEPPDRGSLPGAQARRLVEVLRRFTSSEDCYYAVWEGFGALAVPVDGTATFAMPSRTMLLLRGPIADAATVSMTAAPFEQSPSLWWPADRAWCVATDVDHLSTYIGAGQECVRAILDEPSLETWPVEYADRIDIAGDTANQESLRSWRKA